MAQKATFLSWHELTSFYPRKRVLILSVLLISSIGGFYAPDAQAACQEGKEVECSVNGLKGVSICTAGVFLPCIAIEEPTETGQVRPDYLILTVIYAPPGSATGSGSSVSYGSGSTTGTTTTNSSSFKEDFALKVSVGVGTDKVGSGSAGLSFSTSSVSGSSNSVSISKSETSTISADGPPTDGVDHSRDMIYLWLNPVLNFEIQGDDIRWTFAEGDAAVIQFLFVHWLQNPDQTPANVMATLNAHDVTVEDFPTILNENPAALGVDLDPERYEPLLTTIPYQPAAFDDAAGPTHTVEIKSSESTSSSGTSSSSYTVGVQISGGFSFKSIFSAKMESSASWTITNSSTVATSDSTDEISKLTMRNPSSDYDGPTVMEVYFDNLYKTFLFRPQEIALPLVASGSLFDAQGEPAIFEEIELFINGRWHRTFTDASGTYRFSGNSDDELLMFRTSNQRWAIPAQPVDQAINLSLNPIQQ